MSLIVTMTVTKFGGNVYCGAFDHPSDLTDVNDIKVQGFMTSVASSASYNTEYTASLVSVTSLAPQESHYIYCHAEDSIGNEASLADALSTEVVYLSECQAIMRFAEITPSTALSTKAAYEDLPHADLEDYKVNFDLSSVPVDVNIEVQFFSDISRIHRVLDVFSVPSSFSFTSGTSLLTKSFLVYGSVGTYYMDLVATVGGDSYHFDDRDTIIEVVSEGLKPPPILHSALIDGESQTVIVKFNSQTDMARSALAGEGDLWPCHKVFAFSGDAFAACVWTESSVVTVIQNHYGDSEGVLLQGSDLAILGGVLTCRGISCSGDYTDAMSVTVGVLTMVLPKLVVKAPSLINGCDDVVIDATQSTGHVGTNWKTLSWEVSSSSGVDVSSLVAFLNSVEGTFEPIVVPRNLFNTGTYHITILARNILQNMESLPSTKTIFIEVGSGQAATSVFIEGPGFITMKKTHVLSKTASVSTSVCNAASETQTTTYTWRVYRGGVLLPDISSSSSSPNVFALAANTLSGPSTYTITCDVTVVYGALTMQASKSLQVYVMRDDVSAVVNGFGTSALTIPVASDFNLSGGNSVVNGGSYRWVCAVSSAAGFGDDCFAGTSISTETSTLSIPANTLAVSNYYTITLVVTKGSASDYTSVSVYSVASSESIAVSVDGPAKEVIADTKVIVSSTISASDSEVSVEWSVGSESMVVLANSSIGPVFRQFSAAETGTGVLFPVGLTQYTLVGYKMYTFRLAVVDPAAMVYNEVAIEVNFPPHGGQIYVDPWEGGVAFLTEFSWIAPNWGDNVDDYPLSYTFVFQVSEQFDAFASSLPVGIGSERPFAQSTLPEGTSNSDSIACAVIVSDCFGARANKSQIIHVGAAAGEIPSRRLANAYTHSLVDSYIMSTIVPAKAAAVQSLVSGGDIVEAFRELIEATNYLTYVDTANCTLAPDCASINRQDCSAVSHTCGACLDGYTGVFGDSNHACSLQRYDVGSLCSTDTECEFGSCVNSLCTVPFKTCPVGKVGGNECSGRGECVLSDYHHNSMRSINCTVDNTNCMPKCVCDDGYFGVDCGLEAIDYESRDAARGDMCDALTSVVEKLDSNVFKLGVLTKLFSSVFRPDEVHSTDSLRKCGSVVDAVSEELDTTSVDSAGDVHVSLVNDIISDLVLGDAYLRDSIYQLLEKFRASVDEFLMAGQYPFETASDNLRLSFHYDLLSDLLDTTLFSSQTREEAYYDAPVAFVDLPKDGIGGCVNFDDYAKLMMVSWGYSPFDTSSVTDLRSSLFRIAAFPTTANLISSGNDIASTSTYNKTMKLLTPMDPAANDATCYEFHTIDNTFTKCRHCDVSDFTWSDVTLKCRNVESLFCPAPVNSMSSVSFKELAERNFNTPISRKLQNGEDRVFYVAQVKAKGERISTKSLNRLSVPATTSYSIWIFLFLIGIVLLTFWDLADRRHFIYQRNRAIENKSLVYNLSDAFDERGEGGEQIIFSTGDSDHSDDEGVPAITITDGSEYRGEVARPEDVRLGDDKSDGPSFTRRGMTTSFPATSLLNNDGPMTRLWTAVKRHHRWIRIFTYPSMSKTRLIRFFVVSSDVMVVVFATCLFFMIAYPNDEDNTCDGSRTKDNCLSHMNRFQSKQHLCKWDDSEEIRCTLKSPPLDAQFIATVAIIIIAVTIPFRRVLQAGLEHICAKRPIIADVGSAASLFCCLWSEPTPWDRQNKDADRRDDNADESLRQFEVIHDDEWVDEEGGDRAIRVDMDAPRQRLGAPYRFSYCDSITPDEELNVLISSTKEFFNATLENVPIPWRQHAEEEEAAIGGRQLALMGAIMRWMGVHADGTPMALSFWDSIRYRKPVNKMTMKLRHKRKQARWLLNKCTSDYLLGPGQTDFKNLMLIQHFTLEQLSPITRFAVKRIFYNMDRSTSGRLSFYKWFLSWIVLTIMYGVMAYYSYHWTTTNGSKTTYAWALVLLLVLVADFFVNELFQIYFLNRVVDIVRPQIVQIYRVLHNVMRTRLRENYTPSGDIRYVQHISSACRAARMPNLAHLQSAHILNLLDDSDMAISRLKIVNRMRDIGFLSYMALLVPSLMKDQSILLQQFAMDMTLPLLACCVLLIAYQLAMVSPWLLLGIALFVLFVILFLVCIVPSDSFKEMMGWRDREEEIEEDINELRNRNVMRYDLSFSGDGDDHAHFRAMNNRQSEGELPGFQFDLVEFDREIAEAPLGDMFEFIDIMGDSNAKDVSVMAYPPANAEEVARNIQALEASGTAVHHPREVIDEVRESDIYMRSSESEQL